MRQSDPRSAGAVLVTGASTGIGRGLVVELASRGVPVFAGVRRTGDAPTIVREVLLDVTDRDQIASASEQVVHMAGHGGLRAVVNNAGAALAGPLEYVSIDEVRAQFEVNVFGHLALTQALLEPIRAHSEGRVVFTGSVAGRVATPCAGSYAASKHALAGIADALRRELRSSGVQVSTIAPGAVMTPIWDKVAARAHELELPPRAIELYGRALKGMEAYAELARIGWALPPEAVVDAAARALYAPRPRSTYLVGAEARLAVALSSALSARTFDALLGMLDATLSRVLEARRLAPNGSPATSSYERPTAYSE